MQRARRLAACIAIVAGLLLGGALPIAPSLHAQQPSQRDLTQRDLTQRDSLLQEALEGAPSPAAPLDLLLPAGLRVAYLTREWVRDSLPQWSDSLDDLLQLDRIYVRALGEAEGDMRTALFATFVACLETRTIPFTFGLKVPLALEPDSAYERRVNCLPRRLLADLPAGDDRDKLQHFFISAYLTWKLDDAGLADLIGLGVEKGEALFITGGADDPRDVRANRLGQLFAELLRTHPQALPSMMFAAWNREYLRRTGK